MAPTRIAPDGPLCYDCGLPIPEGGGQAWTTTTGELVLTCSVCAFDAIEEQDRREYLAEADTEQREQPAAPTSPRRDRMSEVTMTTEQLQALIASAVADGVKAAKPIRNATGPRWTPNDPATLTAVQTDDTKFEWLSIRVETNATTLQGEPIAFEVRGGFIDTRKGKCVPFVYGSRCYPVTGNGKGRQQGSNTKETLAAQCAVQKQIQDAHDAVDLAHGIGQHANVDGKPFSEWQTEQSA